MQLQPTFSIITITYNAVRLVEQTLLNVLSQSYPNIEYIVIDGGSTDGTVDIIRRYESGLARSGSSCCWMPTGPGRRRWKRSWRCSRAGQARKGSGWSRPVCSK